MEVGAEIGLVEQQKTNLAGFSVPFPCDTATFLRCARAASLKAMGSRFGALAEEEYDKIAPVIACTLPALTDSIPERKRGELAGQVTSELQVVEKAASIAIQTWVRNNDKTKAWAEHCCVSVRERVRPQPQFLSG